MCCAGALLQALHPAGQSVAARWRESVRPVEGEARAGGCASGAGDCARRVGRRSPFARHPGWSRAQQQAQSPATRARTASPGPAACWASAPARPMRLRRRDAPRRARAKHSPCWPTPSPAEPPARQRLHGGSPWPVHARREPAARDGEARNSNWSAWRPTWGWASRRRRTTRLFVSLRSRMALSLFASAAQRVAAPQPRSSPTCCPS